METAYIYAGIGVIIGFLVIFLYSKRLKKKQITEALDFIKKSEQTDTLESEVVDRSEKEGDKPIGNSDTSVSAPSSYIPEEKDEVKIKEVTQEDFNLGDELK